jgi:GTPase
MRTEADI